MTGSAEIAAGVRVLLEGLRERGRAVFAKVDTADGEYHNSNLAQLARMPGPAALVVAADCGSAAPGGAAAWSRLEVLISVCRAAEGAAASGDARAWALARLASSVLDGAVVAGRHRVAAVDEEVLVAGGREVVLALRHVVQTAPARLRPTLDGAAVAGEGAEVAVHLAEAGATVSEESPTCAAAIWTGVLRAPSHAELNAVEERLEAVARDGVGRSMADGCGGEIANCVATCFVRRGPRQMHPVLGTVAQPFELAFRQRAA